jgi:hypothetical protein
MWNLLRPAFLFLAVCTAIVPAVAQSNKAIEADYLRHLKNLEKYSGYGPAGNDTAREKENDLLKQKVIKYSRKAVTLKYGFPALTGKMYVTTSRDGRLRIYSWDTQGGGTAHYFESVFQYLGKSGKAGVWSAKPAEGDACAPFYFQIFQTDATGGRVYLANSTSICSAKLASQNLSLFRIEGEKLSSNVKLIRTKSGLTNNVGFEYDFFSVVNHPERPVKLFFYDEVRRSFRFPVVISEKEMPLGRVTNRWITYRFNGKYFVKVT